MSYNVYFFFLSNLLQSSYHCQFFCFNSSLITVQHELLRVLYPVFIHCFMDLVAQGYMQEGILFSKLALSTCFPDIYKARIFLSKSFSIQLNNFHVSACTVLGFNCHVTSTNRNMFLKFTSMN